MKAERRHADEALALARRHAADEAEMKALGREVADLKAELEKATEPPKEKRSTRALGRGGNAASEEKRFAFFADCWREMQTHAAEAEAKYGVAGGDFDHELERLDKATFAKFQKKYGVTKAEAEAIWIEGAERGWPKRLANE